MPKIGLWRKTRTDIWKYGNMNITANIRGDMGSWKAVIEDREFDGRFNYEFSSRRYTTTRDNLWDQMRLINRTIRRR